MTVKEYISSTLQGITVPDAYLVDMTVDLEAEYTPAMFSEVGAAMVSCLAGLILAPRVEAVNENGFSMRWDTSTLGKYYLWLCKRYGIVPDPEVVSLLGMNTIIDISDTW